MAKIDFKVPPPKEIIFEITNHKTGEIQKFRIKKTNKEPDPETGVYRYDLDDLEEVK